MFSKIEILKNTDRFLGSLISAIVMKFISPRKFSQSVNRILVIRPGGLGDAVLLIPSIKALKKSYPDSKLFVLCEKRNSGVFQICGEIDELFLYDDIRNFDLYRALKYKYDIVIDTEQWHKLSSITGYLTRAPVRLGFDTNGRERLFTKSVSYSHDDYEAESFLNLVNEIIPEKYCFDPDEKFIFLKDSAKNNYQCKIQTLSEQTDAVIGLFYGATVNERKWFLSRYAQLANRLMENNIGVIALGGKADLHEQYDFLNLINRNSRFINLIGKTTLHETAEIISKTALFISADTGLMHLAYGLGTSTLSLFGAGIQKKWAPKGKNNYILNRNLICSPCTEFGYTPECPYGVKCLSEISVDEVYNKALKIIGVLV